MEQIAEKIRQAGLSVNPPIELHEVEAFEREAGVLIPKDYRDFLLTSCNGGIEPCRLVPLQRWDYSYWTVVEPEKANYPCLITPEAEKHGEDWLDELGVEDWSPKWDESSWDPMYGTIAIAEIGCGLYFSMIMNGEYRGRIFTWGDHAHNPPYFVDEPDFVTWINYWLDACIAGKPVHFLNGRTR